MAGSNKRAAVARTADTVDSMEQLDDESVREYLKNNHDFLQRHPDMMDYLHISHASGSAVSLVEKQVSVLRERNMDMRHRLSTLSASARENDKLFEQSSKMVLKLLEAASAEELYTIFTATMSSEFDVEHACMIIYGEDETTGYRVEPRANADEQIGSLFRGHKSVCGTLRNEELEFLFPGCKGSGSAAIMPLMGEEALGLIAVGSSDAGRYSSDMGTLFLSHIADVVSRLLPRLSA